MSHAILLGDLIFDNARYVGGGPDVIAQVRERLPHDWRATLLAVDGDVTSDVPRQLRNLPADATHLVISAGGNDALGQAGVLGERAASVAEALTRIAGIAARFEADYRAMLQAVSRCGLPFALCTIYYPQFPDAALQRVAIAALAHFNDAILRAAFESGAPILDLRLICNQPADYANEIEPSSHGGAKIADAICRLLAQQDFAARRTVVFV